MLRLAGAAQDQLEQPEVALRSMGAIWLWHGIAVYGYLALWLHDCIAIELDGYVVIQLCHGMAVYG